MDRTAWIAVTVSIVCLMGWQFYVTSKYPPVPVKHAPAAVAAPAQASPGATAAAVPGTAPIITSGQPEVVADRKEATPALAATPEAPEQIETVKTEQIELHFTSLGGGIAEAIPLGKQHVAENGVNIQLGHAGHTPIGALSATADENTRLPYTLHREGNTVTAERTEPDGLKISKEYSLDYQGDPKQIPAVRMKVSFTNTGAQPYRNAGYFIHAGAASPIHRKDLPNYTAYDWLTEGKYHTDHVTSFEAGHVPLVGIETHAAKDVIATPISKVGWIAVKNQFYATVVTPLDIPGVDQEPAAREVWAKRIDLPPTPEDTAQGLPVIRGIDVALGLPALELKPGETQTRAFQIYAGPKFFSRLERLGHDEQEVMDYGKFKLVSITLLALLNTFHKWLGNYALAIILLTILVKAVLFPLQNKANKSMKRMSALTPELTKLREKYKDDPGRLNKETMALYKTNGVNPVGGCLPMVIQMPIFFGFLYMLYPAAELRNAGFLWVHDLSQPDTVAHFAGFPINVLPLLMIGTQFWQMSLTPKSGDPQQQKTMMFMPLLFGFFCYNFAAALALYYTMQGLLTILQLYITRTGAAPAAGGAGEVTVLKPEPPGGGGKRGGANGKGGSKFGGNPFPRKT